MASGALGLPGVEEEEDHAMNIDDQEEDDVIGGVPVHHYGEMHDHHGEEMPVYHGGGAAAVGVGRPWGASQTDQITFPVFLRDKNVGFKVPEGYVIEEVNIKDVPADHVVGYGCLPNALGNWFRLKEDPFRTVLRSSSHYGFDDEPSYPVTKADCGDQEVIYLLKSNQT